MRYSKSIYWGAQITGWLSYGLLIILATYNDSPQDVDFLLILKALNLVVQGILFTHLMRYINIKFGWLDLKLIQVIPRIILISFVFSTLISFGTLGVGIIIDFFANDPFEGFSGLELIVNVFALAVLVLFWNAIYFTYHYFQKSKTQELNNLSLEASKNEIELKNLRSQLNPHFLFNSLNSIRALIDLDPSKAKHSVTTLSNLLRKSLIMGKEDFVSLATELEMVSHYLELEKVRFEERLVILWDIDDRLNEVQIPPFCLQMLVENAIKHGISNMIEGGEIKIKTWKEQGCIKIQVDNSGELNEKVDTGIGIANTRRRLDIQYKGRAEFILAQKKNKVVATLIFQDENI